MIVALRIDVDTLRGTRRGVPGLLEDLAARGILASFFFSVGPDNMGRHLFRLLRPAFAAKMLRSRAPSLYGWDILLRGTLGPGPIIGRACGDEIRRCFDAGHEVGLHAWDHHRWQARAHRMDERTIVEELGRGAERLEAITGARPDCFAAPGWRANDNVVRAEAALGFRYASDCRGSRPFLPMAGGVAIGPPQVPVTLPTFDEVAGRDGAGPEAFARIILDTLRSDAPNVLTVHAEVEGIVARPMMAEILDGVRERGGRVVPLGDLVVPGDALPVCPLEWGRVPGREGTLATQGRESSVTAA